MTIEYRFAPMTQRFIIERIVGVTEEGYKRRVFLEEVKCKDESTKAMREAEEITKKKVGEYERSGNRT